LARIKVTKQEQVKATNFTVVLEKIFSVKNG